LTDAYLRKRLEQWSQGFHATAELMPQIASTLSADEIDALASYLSFVK
jgi:cytochrome c553